MSTITNLEGRIQSIQERISEAAHAAGRDPDEITLIAVSKTFPREDVDAAVALGIHHLGENRVQEAREKFEASLPASATLHLIGHLQSNKAKQVPGLFQSVDSVDRASIVEALDKAAARAGITLDVLLQVNIAGEAQKAGCAPGDAAGLLGQVAAAASLVPRGLMTIAPIDAQGNDLRSVFRRLRELRDRLQEQRPGLDLQELSMGMSNDYEEAIAEGATQIRIGRAIFGGR